MDLCDPVSIILVTAGSRGQSLLFRYPFIPPCQTERREKGKKLSFSNYFQLFRVRCKLSDFVLKFGLQKFPRTALLWVKWKKIQIQGTDLKQSYGEMTTFFFCNIRKHKVFVSGL